MRTITKKKFYLIMTVVCAVVIVIMLGVRFVDASDSSTPKYKYYTSYKVKANDTLTSIAEEYTKDTNISVSDYISDLKNDNRLNDDEITEGKNIIISYYSDIKK
ncbi:MAG: LysM peptidoglycan-binding domain-containing protein [Eubacterium sp.]|nr:LysM peptidoglycan-binding domain-containing protein [Eubacterium sp.]